MVDNPERHFEEIAASGGDTVSFHYEVVPEPAALAARARAYGLVAGLAFNPETSVADAARAAEGLDHVLCMSIHPGYSGQPFLPESLDRVCELRRLLPAHVPIEVDGGVGAENVVALCAAGASLLVAGNSIFGRPDPAAAYQALAELVGPADTLASARA
jgi:ribulose-phosphate 3-epimerase